MEPSVEVLKGLLASAPDAVVAIEPGGRIVFVNDRAEHLFGWARAELAGQPMELLVPDGLSEPLDRPNLRTVEPGLELLVRRRDGTELPAEIRLSTFTTSEGPVVAATIREVTVAPRIEPEAARHEAPPREDLGRLAGGVAHDFNNLLAVILNYATMLNGRSTDPVATSYLEEILAAAERGVGLTRQLFTLAHRSSTGPLLGGHERILLVEDETALREGMARLLADQGYDVLAAVDGKDALEVLDRATDSISLVVTDVAMPRMRGDELVRHLAEQRPDLKVICMSGYEPSPPMFPGRFLAKPVAEDLLLQTIREVLDG